MLVEEQPVRTAPSNAALASAATRWITMLLRSVPPPVCLRHPPDYRWTIDLTVRDRQSGRSEVPHTGNALRRPAPRPINQSPGHPHAFRPSVRWTESRLDKLGTPGTSGLS